VSILIITTFSTRETRRVPPVKQELVLFVAFAISFSLRHK